MLRISELEFEDRSIKNIQPDRQDHINKIQEAQCSPIGLTQEIRIQTYHTQIIEGKKTGKHATNREI